jgi:lipoprotein-releasing system ATP-binding protein
MAELVVQGVTKEFPTRTEPLRVLRGIDLELSRGESAAIVGPSGSGKSTLLQIIGTLDQPTSGIVRLDREDPFALSPDLLAAFRNQRIGFVFQDHHLLPQLSALENVLVPALAQGRADRKATHWGRQLLERVGLADRLAHRPAELSGGERQRVAIARALLHRPLLILADEPTGNLDETTAQQVARLLLEMQQAPDTRAILLVVTHSLDLARRMQHCWSMHDGRLVELDAAESRSP